VTNGHVLFSTGDPTGDVCFVLSGRFSIIRYSVKGYEVRLSTLGPGEWVGEMAALSAQPRSAFVIAAKDSTVATISKGKFLNLMQTNGHFATKIAQLLSARLNEASQRMFEFAASNSEDRVYSEVFRLSAPAVRPEIRTIEPAPSVTEIAARLSMARETASRAISRLEKMRLLDRQAHVWQVTVPSEIAHNTR
jgi:CRP-like cAMP-binding protein